MKGFYITGENGSYIEFEDGIYADTVNPDTNLPGVEDPYEALDQLHKRKADFVSAEEWQAWANWDNDQLGIKDYVRA
jgi:hypothetical protein